MHILFFLIIKLHLILFIKSQNISSISEFKHELYEYDGECNFRDIVCLPSKNNFIFDVLD